MACCGAAFEADRWSIETWDQARRPGAVSRDALLVHCCPGRLRLAVIDGVTPTECIPEYAGVDGAIWAAALVRASLLADSHLDACATAANGALRAAGGVPSPRDRPQASFLAADLSDGGVELVRAGDCEAWTRVPEGWLRRVGDFDGDGSLLLLAAAAEIASAVGERDFTALDGAGAGSVWVRSSPRSQRAAVQRLGGKGDEWALRVLRERTRDRRRYVVRLAAALELAGGAEHTWEVLGPDLQHQVDSALAMDWDRPDRDPLVEHDISVAGWILPALAPRLQEPHRADAARLVDTLISLVPKLPPGTEASLAQGFKFGALHNPPGPVLPATWQLLHVADFWYSR